MFGSNVAGAWSSSITRVAGALVDLALSAVPELEPAVAVFAALLVDGELEHAAANNPTVARTANILRGGDFQ